MKPPRQLKPMRTWALCSKAGRLSLGLYGQILRYDTRKAASYDCSKANQERVVKILITEVTK